MESNPESSFEKKTNANIYQTFREIIRLKWFAKTKCRIRYVYLHVFAVYICLRCRWMNWKCGFAGDSENERERAKRDIRERYIRRVRTSISTNFGPQHLFVILRISWMRMCATLEGFILLLLYTMDIMYHISPNLKSTRGHDTMVPIELHQSHSRICCFWILWNHCELNSNVATVHILISISP